ncbi:HlyU family transcriptional regulator [Photobacterium toruni]|uniref:HlyU family transcriptional regulator n=1 Tax=Photobacterium toruni TaxID=1935446 RepID=A0A1T4REN4_9GAMM|nr:HlyU family transcriptional regulator [Photobacterium toruni]MEC6813534.1 HlyU family transcriptional regulator [Photobacterium toruni]MEC6830655.1 HlyU family transcriptional regulator [Photobacterium toruni]SKA14266.1 Transcriptional activator HlyU [Photobacterium toruni]
MGLFSWIFGNKSVVETATVEPVEYKGYLIYPEPQKEGGQFRIAGRICKKTDDIMQTHHFIRSDILPSRIDAETFMLKKAQMFIDQTGDRMFK